MPGERKRLTSIQSVTVGPHSAGYVVGAAGFHSTGYLAALYQQHSRARHLGRLSHAWQRWKGRCGQSQCQGCASWAYGGDGHETAWAATVGAGPGHDGIGKGTSRCCRQVPGATAAVVMPDAVGARSVTHQHVHKAVEERAVSIKGTGRNH